MPLQAIRVVLRHDTIAATPAYLADNSLRRTTTAPCVLDLPQRGLVVTAKSLVRWRFGELETFDVERGVGTRLIVRRERPHPGAQLSLFDTIEGLRHTAFITDTPSRDIAGLELRHRQRARAEQVVRDAKACGLSRLPFDAGERPSGLLLPPLLLLPALTSTDTESHPLRVVVPRDIGTAMTVGRVAVSP